MSNKRTPVFPVDLEKELRDYYASPEPSREFVTRLERELHSKFNEKEKSRVSIKFAKLKLGLGIAFAAALIIFLVTSPTVVAAMMRLFGYIPNIGLVESGSPLRVLAEPVSLTRDGITITVQDVVISSQGTVVLYTLNNLPPFVAPPDLDALQRCGPFAVMKLPDGTSLEITGGQGGEDDGNGDAKYHVTYEPLPANVNEATLVLSCIPNTQPGTKLPKNWELPLRFIPAPSDLIMSPVYEVMPSHEAANENTLILERVIETKSGYILLGQFHAMNLSLPDGAKPFGITPLPKVADAKGHDVLFTLPEGVMPEIDLSAQVFSWAIEIVGKQYNWPLTITYESLHAAFPDARTEFEFDTGPNPQTGQIWDLNLDLEIAGYPLRVVSVTRTGDGYDFAFESESWVRGVGVTIAGATPRAARGGGQDSDGKGYFISHTGGYENVPSGDLTIILSNPGIEFLGPWQLQWQPDDALPGMNPPEQ